MGGCQNFRQFLDETFILEIYISSHEKEYSTARFRRLLPTPARSEFATAVREALWGVSLRLIFR